MVWYTYQSCISSQGMLFAEWRVPGLPGLPGLSVQWSQLHRQQQ